MKNIYIDFYQADNSRSTLAFLSDGENAIGVAKIYAIAIHETAGLKTAPDAALFAIFTVNPVLVTDE